MHTLAQTWQWTVPLALLLASVAALVWLLRHRKPTEAELERDRRLRLVSYGRLVDDLLLDFSEIPGPDGTVRLMLLYQYEIAGVNYECAQDVTALGDTFRKEPTQAEPFPVGLPCSVRYQPGSPMNSIVLAETWSGLRMHATLHAARPLSPFARARHIRTSRVIG